MKIQCGAQFNKAQWKFKFGFWIQCSHNFSRRSLRFLPLRRRLRGRVEVLKISSQGQKFFIFVSDGGRSFSNFISRRAGRSFFRFSMTRKDSSFQSIFGKFQRKSSSQGVEVLKISSHVLEVLKNHSQVDGRIQNFSQKKYIFNYHKYSIDM